MIRRLGFILLVVALAAAQDRPTFRIKVDLVVLSFTITDNKGHYVNGLKPSDFRIEETPIPTPLTQPRQAFGCKAEARRRRCWRGSAALRLCAHCRGGGAASQTVSGIVMVRA